MTDHRAIQDDLPPDSGQPAEPSNIQESSLYMRAIVWASELPWWAIILGTGVVATIYLMLTSAIYQDILRQLTDDPQLQTDNLFEVVEVVGEPTMITGRVVGESTDSVVTVVDQLLEQRIDSEIVTRAGFILDETPATITILTDEGRRTVFKEFITGLEREEREGMSYATVDYVNRVTVTGTLVERDDDTMRVRVRDEEKVTIQQANIIGQEPATGDDGEARVTIARRGEQITGRLSALSNTSLSLQDAGGDRREFRLNEIEWYTVPTLTVALNTAAAERDILPGDTVTIGYVQGTDIVAALDRLDDLDDVPVPLRYNDGQATVVLQSFPNLNALLLATNLGSIDALLYLDATPERFAVRDWAQDNPNANIVLPTGPRECVRDCPVTVKLEDDTITGTVLEEDETRLVLQTTAPEYVTIDRDLIVDTRREEPGDCALNNLRGCNEGIFLTLQVTVMAYILALVIGLIIGIMRVPSTPTSIPARLLYTVTHNFATMYVEIVRGLPLLVILLYAGFVISPQIRDHTPLNLSDTQEAILGLSFGYGAFIAEIFRAGIQSIGRGQMEAARSLGMSYPQAMRHVILPQAVRVVLPPLGNDFIALLKDSALISVLALPDILQLGRLYISRTFLAIEGYNTVAVLYLMMTLFLSMLVRVIERRSRLPN